MLTQVEYYHPSVYVEWIPPSTEYLVLWIIQLKNGFDAEKLPRELRFLLLNECFIKDKEKLRQKFNFGNLPEEIEEFHVLHGKLFGDIVITSLPQTLRILQVKHEALCYVHLDALAFPKIDNAYVFFGTRTARKPKIIWLGDTSKTFPTDKHEKECMTESSYGRELLRKVFRTLMYDD